MSCLLARNLRIALFGVFTALAATADAGDTPTDLHTQIDKVISAELVGSTADVCTDAEFLRRIYLDLVGTIPSVSEARQFLDDASSNKRTVLIDRLMDDPRFDRNFMRVFDVILMERTPQKYVDPGSFREFLRTSFEQRKRLDQIVREIIVADGADEQLRPRARFLLERDVQPHVVTRDVGRLFLGTDLQCAQCHDHPSIDDYLQSDYYGIYAFLNRSYLFQNKDDDKARRFVAEKAEGEISFFSVFEGGDPEEMKPHMPGAGKLDEPIMDEDQRYVVAPSEGIRPVPKYSRRARLAQELTSGKYTSFQRNLANRLWAHMLGRGIVHPLDMHHSDNPPVHPELLEVLANGLVEFKYDLRRLLRAIAMSQTYQRSSTLPDELTAYARSEKATADALRIEQRRTAVRAELAVAQRQWEVFNAELSSVSQRWAEVGVKLKKQTDNENSVEVAVQLKGELAALGRMRDQLAQLKNQADAEVAGWQRQTIAVDAQLKDVEILRQFVEVEKEHGAKSVAANETLGKIERRWRDRFACGQVPPLTAEQLTWSISEALGVTDRFRDEIRQQEKQRLEQNENDKAAKPDLEQQHRRIESMAYSKVSGALYNFITNTHDDRGQPLGHYQATTAEPLFLTHSPQIQGWVNGGHKSLVDRLTVQQDETVAADELYLALLSRHADPEEKAIVKVYLAARPDDQVAAYRDLIWALLSAAEFRFQF